MTITDITPVALDLRGQTDDQIAALYYSDDQDTSAAALAEMDRRDRAAKMTAARRTQDGILAEGYDAAFAQYLKASDYTRGNLLSELGRKRLTDEMSLWTGSQETAERYASEELRDFWMFVEPRMSPGRYARQRGTQARIEREEARDERGSDEELAGYESRALRRESPAEDTQDASGPGGPVSGGGRGSGEGEDGSEDGTGAGGPGGPVRGDGGLVNPAGDEEHGVGDLKYVLDETARFVEDHVAADRARTDAMVLYAAATHALAAFPTFGRMLFTSEHEASGKTMAMLITATLSANPLDAAGTPYALTSALAAAGNTPDQPAPALYYDEISSVFGRSGLAASRNPIADILRKGYKQGATSQWSVNRVNEKFSIYTPFIMTGLRVAVPRDIRSRCICITMEPGTPRQYFDARTAEPEAQALAACLAQAAGKRLADIAAFRARGIHPKLKDRKLEVWEGMFAVAYVLGGQEWLNRCLAAFKELALAESDQVVLTPRQQTIKDVAAVAAKSRQETVLPDGTRFIGGLAIVDELRRVDNPIYQGRSDAGLALLVSDALPMNTVQLRVDGDRVRGYYVQDIEAAWNKIRPDEPDDIEIPDEVNPFEVDEEDETAGQQDEETISAGQHDVTDGTEN
jgi:Protein of unknown function (DUF3631)